jgi:hypothetical protein
VLVSMSLLDVTLNFSIRYRALATPLSFDIYALIWIIEPFLSSLLGNRHIPLGKRDSTMTLHSEQTNTRITRTILALDMLSLL